MVYDDRKTLTFPFLTHFAPRLQWTETLATEVSKDKVISVLLSFRSEDLTGVYSRDFIMIQLTSEP